MSKARAQHMNAYQPGLFDQPTHTLTEAARLLTPEQRQIMADAGLDTNRQAALLIELASGRVTARTFGWRAQALSRAQALEAADGGQQTGLFAGL